MTIFYIIGNLKARNTGKGGSFHSSASVAKAVSANDTVCFIVIGDFQSEAVNNILGDKAIFLNTVTFLDKIKSIVKYTRLLFEKKPDIIHVFGNNVLFLSYLGNILVKAKTVFTKCGKGNNKIDKNYFSNVITLSRENYNYFKDVQKDEGIIKNLAFIPHRIFPFKQDELLIEELKKKIYYQENDFIILRIGRLSKYYTTGIIQSLQYFHSEIKKRGNVKLVLIGHRDNELEIPEHLLHKNIFIIEEPQFTNNPKSLLSLGDVKIANGRCAMESCFVGGDILIPSKEQGLIKLNKKNWEELLHFNFSERCIVHNGKGLARNIEPSYTREIFDNNFNIEMAVPQIKEFYEKSYLEPVKPKQFLVWFYIFFKKF